MIAVTPSLFAGQPADRVWFSDLHWADTVGEAVAIIEDGQSALIAREGWEEKVWDILGLLGATAETIEWAISTAPRVNEVNGFSYPPS
jgi:hypothetical protein